MAVSVSSRVWKHSPAHGSDRLVLLALADHATEEGHCHPSVTTLARLACLSERQVQISLGSLRDAGEIAVIPGGGARRTGCYAVLSGLEPAARARTIQTLPAYRERVQSVRGNAEETPNPRTNYGESRIEESGVPTPDHDPIRHVLDPCGGGGICAGAQNEPDHPLQPAEAPVYAELIRLGVGADRARDLAPRATLAQVAYLEASGRAKARDLAGWVVSGIMRNLQPPAAAREETHGGPHPGDHGGHRTRPAHGGAHRGGGAGGQRPAHAPPRPNQLGAPPPGLTPDELKAWARERVRAIQATRC